MNLSITDETAYDIMTEIFYQLPEKMRDDFVSVLMEAYELYTLDQACEALAELRQI